MINDTQWNDQGNFWVILVDRTSSTTYEPVNFILGRPVVITC
jgi:hypothetical protein